MIVAIDISSTTSGHQSRGIGFYTKRLLASLEKLPKKGIQILPFDASSSDIPKADLYHFPAFTPFFWSFPFSLIRKSIFTIHDLIPLEYPDKFPAGIRGNLRWQIQKMLLPLSKHIITDSIASKKSILKLTSLKKEKITPIYLAADSEFCVIKEKSILQNIMREYQLPEKFVLYVGDMNWHKNVLRLAEVCVKLQYPLVVVGKQATNHDVDIMHPWNQELVKFQVYAQNYSNLIKLLGFVPTKDLVALYNLATFSATLSLAEGFGLPILEAMQSGCPVLTSNCSSLSEIAGNAGLLVDPTKNKDIKLAMEKLWNDDKMREEYREKGLQRAKEFSWEKTAQETMEIYKSQFPS